jgi:hypothetical protein
MAKYPTTPKPQYPYELTTVWKTIISSFDSGTERRRQKQTYPKFNVSLTYETLTKEDIQTLWNFYIARKGAYEAFYFFTPDSADWNGLYIGTGDASTVTFDIPGTLNGTITIYNNGVEVDSGDYTLLVGGGVEGSDRVTFDTAPGLNEIITCDFTGYMRIRCRFEEDEMTRSGFTGALYKTGLKMKGLTAL